MPPVPAGEIQLIVHLGVMLFLGLVAGEIITHLKIPRVTGYLFAGMLIGPSVLGFIGEEDIRDFDLIAQLALGLIMFNIGGQFEAGSFRRFAGRLLTVTIGEMGATWMLVSVVFWFISRDLVLSTVAGFIAMATAPATTLVVVKEYDSEGPLTSNLIALVGLNNFFCLVLFPLVLVALSGQGLGFGFPFAHIGKSLLLGAGLGLGLSYVEEHVHPPKQQFLLGLCAVTLVVGLAYAWGSSGPLSALMMGVAKINSSTRGPALFDRIDTGAYPLYVLFFVIAGANLHLETLAQVGFLGAAYIGVRAAAKVAGAAAGAHVAGLSSSLTRYLGPAMISHAGVAIGLAMAIGSSGARSAKAVEAVVLGSIVVYEIIGPIAVRYSLVRCGEVKMISLLPHLPGQSAVDNIERIIATVKRNLGFRVGGLGETEQPMAAKHVMRTNIETVPDNARFDELLKIIAHARYDLFPVVDREGRYIGNFNFHGIRDLIFDQALADLVIARDLLDHGTGYVTPDDPLGEVLQKFHNAKQQIQSLPVVMEGERPRVVGMIRQRDVVDIFRRLRAGEGA